MSIDASPRILIVDDEFEITEILSDLLSENYECLKAGTAEQAPCSCRRANSIWLSATSPCRA